ncbi:MAG TPA: urease accessory protein UreD [Burkholderiaceae bacterium]|nr:urease accessory protein UreD [Burkholderiaceae bacterium]
MRVAEPIFAPWKADLSLGFRYEDNKTVLFEKRFDGPLVVQKPLYPEGDAVCHAIVVHPPAGIVGGDQLSLRINAEPKSAVLLTTPGAGKWYRSAGPWASQKLRFEVDGSLEWLPQETIVFDGALADMECEVNLGTNASYIGWEILCLGRAGSGERFNKGRIELRNKICRNGTPLWRERGAIDAGGRLMHSPAGLSGKSVCATLIAAAPQISSNVVAACRQVQDVAVTMLPGLLIARHLGDSSESAKQRFVQLWQILRPAIHDRVAQSPRIWRT